MTADPDIQPPSTLEKVLTRAILFIFFVAAVVILLVAYEAAHILLGLLHLIERF